MSNLIPSGWDLLLLTVIAGFALYDIRHKRVPNKALAFSLPVFLAAPFIHAAKQGLPGIFPAGLSALLGAAVYFLLALAMGLGEARLCLVWIKRVIKRG